MGFFTSDQYSIIEDETTPQCGKCGLYLKCESPRMPVTGEGKRKVLIVAEAPGAEEDRRNEQLVGQAGQVLRDTLDSLDYDLDVDCWKTNAVICRPEDNKMEQNFINCCKPNLIKTIKELNPRTIILLGASAVKSFLSSYWRKDIGAMERWAGWNIPLQPINTWVCPTFHPSYILRKQGNVPLEFWFRKHLEEAMSHTIRPWKEVPNWINEVDIIGDSTDAVERIKAYAGTGPIAFDYETDRIKPDAKDSRIICASICGGGFSIAFPWTPEVQAEMSKLLRSNTPKVGANIKFEQRWTKAIMGHGVKAWLFDTMQAAHILDNRPGITSLKFQAFVRFGQPLWDEEVESFIKAPDANTKNRLDEMDLQQLMLYCGMDSLMEYKLWMLQQGEIKDGYVG